VGGTPVTDATSRGQLVIMRMKGRLIILSGCCTQSVLYLAGILRNWLGAGDSQSWNYAVCGVYSTQCMQYTVYAVLGVNS
jgi:hypothetical protein